MGLRIGLTGGIGSGKSTAATIFQEAGATVVDTDAIARQLTASGGEALPAIAQRFGVVKGGELDRAALRSLVFADPIARRDLERLLHPLINAAAQRQAMAHPLVVFDVPLLVETGHWRTQVDRVLVIDCDADVQRQRVLARPGWTGEQLDGVLRAQATRQQRRAAADAVIDNSRLSMNELKQQIHALLAQWRMKESSD